MGANIWFWFIYVLCIVFGLWGSNPWRAAPNWGPFGSLVAVFILRLVRTDLTLLAIDPNVTAIVEGTIMVVVVMLGAFLAMRGRSP